MCKKKMALWEFRVKSYFSIVSRLKFSTDSKNRCCQSQFCRQLPVSPPYWKMATKIYVNLIIKKHRKLLTLGHMFLLLTNMNIYPENMYTNFQRRMTSFGDVIGILLQKFAGFLDLKLGTLSLSFFLDIPG